MSYHYYHYIIIITIIVKEARIDQPIYYPTFISFPCQGGSVRCYLVKKARKTQFNYGTNIMGDNKLYHHNCNYSRNLIG